MSLILHIAFELALHRLRIEVGAINHIKHKKKQILVPN